MKCNHFCILILPGPQNWWCGRVSPLPTYIVLYCAPLSHLRKLGGLLLLIVINSHTMNVTHKHRHLGGWRLDWDSCSNQVYNAHSLFLWCRQCNPHIHPHSLCHLLHILQGQSGICQHDCYSCTLGRIKH